PTEIVYVPGAVWPEKVTTNCVLFEFGTGVTVAMLIGPFGPVRVTSVEEKVAGSMDLLKVTLTEPELPTDPSKWVSVTTGPGAICGTSAAYTSLRLFVSVGP